MMNLHHMKSDAQIELPLREQIFDRVLKIRNRFYAIYYARMKELLPTIIKYIYINDKNQKTYINWLEIETHLRNGYACAVGINRLGNLCYLGYINDTLNYDVNNMPIFKRRYNYHDINFIIPNELIPKKEETIEISPYDEFKTGNFVILRNKVLNYVSDYYILEYYCEKLAEIEASRFSLTIQSKVLTVFLTNENGTNVDDLNNIISDIYNGKPYGIIGNELDPDEILKQFNTEGVTSLLTELKRENQNTQSELHNMLGINSLGVNKESGVNLNESEGNKPFTSGNGNIHLEARNKPLEALEIRTGIKIRAIFNDDTLSMMDIIRNQSEKGDNY